MAKMDKKTAKKLKKAKNKNIFNYSSFFSANLTSITIIILLLVSVGYLYAKNQELEKSQQEQASPAIPTHLITPTTQAEQPVKQKTNIIKNAVLPTPLPTSVPLERKKVAVTLTDPSIAGTYYCYEDKANGIMTTQNALNLAIKTLDICSSTLSFKLKTCFDDCTQKTKTCINNCYDSEDVLACTNACNTLNASCGDSCPKGTECSDQYSSNIDKLRSQLQQQRFDYCP